MTVNVRLPVDKDSVGYQISKSDGIIDCTAYLDCKHNPLLFVKSEIIVVLECEHGDRGLGFRGIP